MNLFKREQKVLPPLWDDGELGELTSVVDYNSVIDWLQGLSDTDYDTVCKVAVIYRNANKEATTALGIVNEPTTHILPPVEPIVIDKTTIDDSPEFLDMPPHKRKPERKIKVKS